MSAAPSCSLYPSAVGLEGPIFFTNHNGKALWLQIRNPGDEWPTVWELQPGGSSSSLQLVSESEINWAGHEYLAIDYNKVNWCRDEPEADQGTLPPASVPTTAEPLPPAAPTEPVEPVLAPLPTVPAQEAPEPSYVPVAVTGQALVRRELPDTGANLDATVGTGLASMVLGLVLIGVSSYRKLFKGRVKD